MIRKNQIEGKRFILIVLCTAILISFMPFVSDSFSADAAGSIKMTTYDQVIKSGNTIYCAGAKGIYKVKLKKGKVKSSKLLVKAANPLFGAYTYVGKMKKKGGYIYYVHGSEGTMWTLLRVNIGNKKKTTLASYGEQIYFGYVIKGNRIYYDKPDMDTFDYRDTSTASVRSMSLNGKSKKKASAVIPVMTNKNSNAKGYSMQIRESGKYAKDYLKTPKGTFYLGKARIQRY